MKLKINQKNYDVPELTFAHFTKMEEQGFSVIDAFQKGLVFLMSMGFVCVVVDCDREEAERLIEQHVLGGGTIRDINSAFQEAAMNSDFFKRMLGIQDEKPAKKTATKKVAEETPEA